MSENAETNGNVTESSAVDFALGGEDSHSPETTPAAAPENTTEDNAAPDKDTGVETAPEQEPENGAPETDSAAKAPKAAPDVAALEQEVATLTKRLQDTQRAYHEATSARAKLEKERDELKAKRDNEDDWFSEEDKSRLETVEKEIENSNTAMTELDQKAAETIWDAAAAKVRAEHPDFDKVVYEEFAPKLDDASGDPEVKKLWAAETDKSPANAYKFAKELPDRLLMQRDPAAYRAKIEAEVKEKNNKEHGEVTGKDGLDLMNSAVGPEAARDYGGKSAVDFVFDT